TGCGIEAEDMTRVFDRLHRGKSAGNRVEGSGLGLYMVKRICDHNGWKISLDSRPNAGTTVCVEFLPEGLVAKSD
ncbi:MAG: sensor histidine kinase, partial [Burkholderiales bacterium]